MFRITDIIIHNIINIIINNSIFLRNLRIMYTTRFSEQLASCFRAQGLSRTVTSALRVWSRACVHPPPSSQPYPQHGKLFPNIGITISASPVGNTFCLPHPPRGEAKVLLARLRAQYTAALFHFFLYWNGGAEKRVEFRNCRTNFNEEWEGELYLIHSQCID